ncbi:PAS domain S-box-containing protein/diguanylate cyclase (GGDEF) domain-containing protein [Oceanospirillum multiglobuliferum]|uniref:EAL domain-containing protein n=1 Tax=Oceanospirillum multiglobuliferum TaxID=64969 RepID=UPI0009C4D2DD|nr:EAL domain-containing protein [Oceanospirillum multiglobuliferum]SJZ52750.1 PAS domain S-box-containing protein/diguanylate cyclase (GGDEF) domain-containing protein [Oceanospirillum multiglobuliferum]
MHHLPLSTLVPSTSLTALSDETVVDVIAKMYQLGSSSVVILDQNHHPVGILTEQDVVALFAQDASLLQAKVQSVCSNALVTVLAHESCQQALRLMTERQLRHLVLLDEQKNFLGVISEDELIHHMTSVPMQIAPLVKEVMSTCVQQLGPNCNLQDALCLMRQQRISCVVVTEAQRAIGILTERDIVYLAAQQAQPQQLLLREVMHSPVLSVVGDLSVRDAAFLMEQKKVRRFVVEEQSQIKGIITHHDILRSMQRAYVEYLEAELAFKERQIEEISNHIRQFDEQKLLRSLMFQISDSIYVIDAETGDILDVNQQSCAQLGYSREELLKMKLPELSTAALTSNIFSVINQQIRKQGFALVQSQHRHKSGALIPVEVKVSQLHLSDRVINIAIARDQSERLAAERALRNNAAIYQGVISTALDGFWMTDTNGNILDVNQAYCDMSGFSREELLSMRIFDIDNLETETDTLTRIASIKKVGQANFISRHHTKSGVPFDVEVNVTYWPEQGGRFFVFCRNITDKLAAEAYLKLSATVFENTNEAVMIVGADYKIQRVNHAFSVMTGYNAEEVIGQSASLLQSGLHPKSFYEEMWRRIICDGHWQGEVINKRVDGTTYPELLNISVVKNSEGEISHYVGIFADLSKQKASEDKLAFLDYHDPLTGLANRKTLMLRLDHAIRNAQKNKKQVALLLIDLDRFKDVNDSYGHVVGDELLNRVARVLDTELSDIDTLARLGGDEFALLVDEVDSVEYLSSLASQIIRLLNKPWSLSNNVTVTIGASIGISLSPQNGHSANQLLQHTDAALYQAKADGRSRFCYFSETLTQEARYRAELETRMHRALRRHELQVYFQPQIDIKSAKLTGAEALVRWLDPEQGLLSPVHFIDQCEQNGQIIALGRQILEMTCQQGKAWLDQGFAPISLAVNLSARQLKEPHLYQDLVDILTATQYPAEYLELELTESALMMHEHEVVLLLEKIKGLGIRLAIDDFGTGYSSFAYLKRFPIDVLKIDKSFIDDIPYNHEGMEIVSAIIGMGHTLGFEVLAEGVETDAQLAFLALKHCDQYQGYLCSKPITAAEFEQLLSGQQ